MAVDESRLSELQSALRSKMADNKAIADSFKVEDGVVQVSTEQKTAFDKNMADIKEIKSLIDGIEQMRDVERWENTPAADSVASAAAAGAAYAGRHEAKSLGQMFLDSPEFKALNGGRNGANMPSPFVLGKSIADLGYNVKDIYSALPSGTPGSFGSIQRDPIVVPPMRTRRVRDLFPVRTTTAAVIEYFRMTGFTNAASTVAERNGANNAFGAKPQSGFTFAGAQAPVRTLAHWEAAHRNVLADEPQLRSIIDNELMYGLRLAEDDQILRACGVKRVGLTSDDIDRRQLRARNAAVDVVDVRRRRICRCGQRWQGPRANKAARDPQPRARRRAGLSGLIAASKPSTGSAVRQRRR